MQIKGSFVAILFLLFVVGGMCKTKAQWLNGVDFSKATNITVTLTKQSSNVFDISPSLISLTAEKAYSLTLISQVGTTDEYIFSAIEFFTKGIALDSVVTENNIFRAPALLGFGTRKALSSSKKVTLNFVAVEYGQYTLFGGVPGYESQTRTLLKIIIFGSPNNTLQIPELNSYNTRLQNDARKNASHYIWKSVEKIDMVIQDNAPNYNTALLSPYLISLTKSQSAPSHTFISDLFREAIWREVQDSNTKLRLYYLESVQLLQQSGSLSNNSVELFLIPASNKTIGTRFQYNSYVGNVTNNGLIGYFILTAEVKVAISGLINPKFDYDLKYTRIWVVTSTCMTAVIVGVAFISVIRSHFF